MDVKAHWDEVAREGQPLTQDTLLKQLETEHILSHVPTLASVLDAGCGDGQTACYLKQNRPFTTVDAFDSSEEMLTRARQRVEQVPAVVGFFCADVLTSPLEGSYDFVYTERLLINLASWNEQQQAIRRLWDRVVPGGRLLCVESCVEGTRTLNQLRALLGLEPILPPWHNRYVSNNEMRNALPVVSPFECRFTGTYYFLSRVVNAALARQEDRAPAYDAQVNRLALLLPGELVDQCAQTRSWLWTKL